MSVMALVINLLPDLAQMLDCIPRVKNMLTFGQMVGNFFRIALRVFNRNRSNTLINIFGLAIGISFSIIIFLYAHKEISYDRFHENYRRIYRVAIESRIAENEMNFALTSTPLAGTMKTHIPEVEDAVRVARFGAWLLRNDSIRYNEDNLIFSDPSFFKIFSFPLIKGSRENALSRPKSIVLCETAAKRYFGNTDPMGKQLRVENDSTYYTVTGIMKDVPDNSHIHFDMVGALSTFDKMLDNDSWIYNYLYTYFLLGEGYSLENLKDGMNKIVTRYVLPDYQNMLNLGDQSFFTPGSYYRFILQPLTDIHLESRLAMEFEPAGRFLYVYVLIVLAVVILVLSCVNFINLITAQANDRAREVGIRKISGSERSVLVQQFLLESSLLAMFAMALALFFTELALPSFSNYIGLDLSLGELLNSAGFILLVTILILVGIISGIYPAWYLSSFNPQAVIRGHFSPHYGKGTFRKLITMFQLFLAIGAFIMTLIIMRQYHFLVNKNRGYDTENLMVIRRPDALTNRLDQFKQEVISHPSVITAANATSAMGGNFPRMPFYLEGNKVTDNFSSSVLLVSYRFDSTYKIPMKAGRFFSPDMPDDSLSCVINEKAAQMMHVSDPLGKTLIQLADKPGKKHRFKIIGVTNDFYFETLENAIRPLIMILMPGNMEGYLTVRISPEKQDSTVQYLKSVWERYTSAYPFVFYHLDQDRKDYYKPVRTTARIFILLTIITTLMACLSLFALVSFQYNNKKREIGIQKAMGASKKMIILRRSSQILVLVLSASLLAWTGTFLLAKYWLKDYAYHIHINILYFFIASLIIGIISLAAVYYHTCLAAQANPGKVLKYE